MTTPLQTATLILAAFFLLGGGLMVGGAVGGWKWVLESARPLTGRLPVTAVRCLYLLLGLAVIAMALHLTLHL